MMSPKKKLVKGAAKAGAKAASKNMGSGMALKAALKKGVKKGSNNKAYGYASLDEKKKGLANSKSTKIGREMSSLKSEHKTGAKKGESKKPTSPRSLDAQHNARKKAQNENMKAVRDIYRKKQKNSKY